MCVTNHWATSLILEIPTLKKWKKELFLPHSFSFLSFLYPSFSFFSSSFSSWRPVSLFHLALSPQTWFFWAPSWPFPLLTHTWKHSHSFGIPCHKDARNSISVFNSCHPFGQFHRQMEINISKSKLPLVRHIFTDCTHSQVLHQWPSWWFHFPPSLSKVI